MPAASAYLLTWNAPENWNNYHSNTDPDNNNCTKLTQGIANLPEAHATETRFQTWLRLVVERHQFTEVSTSTELSLRNRARGRYRRRAMRFPYEAKLPVPSTLQHWAYNRVAAYAQP